MKINEETIREEFSGFQVLDGQTAETIANAIDNSIVSLNLLPE